jgi:hypothetical protein
MLMALLAADFFFIGAYGREKIIFGQVAKLSLREKILTAPNM